MLNSANPTVSLVAFWGAEKVWPMAHRYKPRMIMSSGTCFVKVGTPMERLTSEQVSVLNTIEEFRRLVKKNYSLNLSPGNGSEDDKIVDLARELVQINKKEERSPDFDYEHQVTSLYIMLVRKRIREMRDDLESLSKRVSIL